MLAIIKKQQLKDKNENQNDRPFALMGLGKNRLGNGRGLIFSQKAFVKASNSNKRSLVSFTNVVDSSIIRK